MDHPPSKLDEIELHRAELNDELLERCAILPELSAAQIEAWVSGLFALWETPADVVSFVRSCEVSGEPAAALAVAALALVAPDETSVVCAEAAVSMVDMMPPVGHELGASRFLQAWEVTAPFGRTLVLGAGVDEVDHAVLVEIDNAGQIVDLHLSGDAREWLPSTDEDTGDGEVVRGLAVRDVRVEEAVAIAAQAWRDTEAAPADPSPSFVANQHFVRSRLQQATAVEAGTAPLLPLRIDRDAVHLPNRGLSAAEVAEANRASLATLVAALRLTGPPPEPSHPGWVEVITGSVEHMNHHERGALTFLEWADWLGVGIGLHRGGSGSPVDGSALVDLVNRCPEVSSTIDRDDRDYVEWAFEIAVEHLVDSGLVADGRLTDLGWSTIVPSLFEAWGPQ